MVSGNLISVSSMVLGGQIISTVAEVFKSAFLKWSPRLMLAMYSCELQTPMDIVGKVYGVLNRRHGKILSEELKDGTTFFTINATMPVVESFGFADGSITYKNRSSNKNFRSCKSSIIILWFRTS